MSIKDFLLDKVELKTETVKIGDDELQIRELTGAQRSEMLAESDEPEKSERICYNAGVVDPNEQMDAAEFAQAFRFNYNAVHKVVLAICRLSGYFDNPDETEKN